MGDGRWAMGDGRRGFGRVSALGRGGKAVEGYRSPGRWRDGGATRGLG